MAIFIISQNWNYKKRSFYYLTIHKERRCYRGIIKKSSTRPLFLMPRKWSISLSAVPGQITNVAAHRRMVLIVSAITTIPHAKTAPVSFLWMGQALFYYVILRLPGVLRYGIRPGRRRFRRGRRWSVPFFQHLHRSVWSCFPGSW